MPGRRSCATVVLLFLVALMALIQFVYVFYAPPRIVLPSFASLSTDFVKSELQGIFIAANYYQNQALLERRHLPALQSVVTILQSHQIPVYVSIYESGSTDGSAELLEVFAAWLAAQQIPHSVIVRGSITSQRHPSRQAKIQALASLRNQALAPLQQKQQNATNFSNNNNNNHHYTSADPVPTVFVNPETQPHTRVVFINDIDFQPAHFFELILNTHQGPHSYDVACAMDFGDGTQFYDTWVTRDLSGQLVLGGYPFFIHVQDRTLLVHWQSVPVYSCWNGMVVLPLSPFAQEQVQFRTWAPREELSPLLPGAVAAKNTTKISNQQQQFTTTTTDANTNALECAWSECALIMKDLHQLGYQRVYINPRVRVTYNEHDTRILRHVSPLVHFFDFWAWKAVEDAYQGHASSTMTQPRRAPAHVQCGSSRPVTWSWTAQCVGGFAVLGGLSIVMAGVFALYLRWNTRKKYDSLVIPQHTKIK